MFQATRLEFEVTALLYKAYTLQTVWKKLPNTCKTSPPCIGTPRDLYERGVEKCKTDWEILAAARLTGKKILCPIAETALCMSHSATPTVDLGPIAADAIRAADPKLRALMSECAARDSRKYLTAIPQVLQMIPQAFGYPEWGQLMNAMYGLDAGGR